ncbi:MAG: aspartate aminotransferase family protein [Mesorhizobium sp.]|nr:MAG: aspartate aminotransferase family protein [Mesorhizobium sp.]
MKTGETHGKTAYSKSRNQSVFSDGDALLSRKGISRIEVENALLQARAADNDPRATFCDRWINDRGLLLDDDAIDVAKAAYLAFFSKNNSYPPIMRFEHELVTMALELFHAGPEAIGSLTSGGSESLFLATASALSAARRDRPGLAMPEVLMAESGHPAFEKYGRYLGYTVRRVPVDHEFRADPLAIARAVTYNTIMIVASVSSWTHGACDPVTELAEIALSGGVWLHVDACVGGFLAPFVRDLGRDVPDFDFQTPGVASISSDFHKYGYSAKGVSGVFYRNGDLAQSQPFVFDAWSAGLYRSPVFTGTRSGGAIAAAWAVARYLGREGYCRRAAQILKLRDVLVKYATVTPELRLLGRAELGTVAIGSNNVDIYAVAAELRARGWTINVLKNPPAVQLVLGPLRDEYIKQLISDFKSAVENAGRDDIALEPPLVVYSDEILDLPGFPVFRGN